MSRWRAAEPRLFKRAERRTGLSAKLKVEFITPPTHDLEESLPIFQSKQGERDRVCVWMLDESLQLLTPHLKRSLWEGEKQRPSALTAVLRGNYNNCCCLFLFLLHSFCCRHHAMRLQLGWSSATSLITRFVHKIHFQVLEFCLRSVEDVLRPWYLRQTHFVMWRSRCVIDSER